MHETPSNEDDRSISQIRTAEDAIIWCLDHRDSGQSLTDREALETFPEHADELQDFFDSERALFNNFSSDVLPGSLPRDFGHYQLHSLIGRGSFGEVRKAWDTKLNRLVALKTPRLLVGNEGAKRRLIREARTASQLAHPNIVRTYEVGEARGTPYICLEFIEGVPLSEWTPLRPVAPDVAATLVSQIADGLNHAHELGIIHRDLNPRNILVDHNHVPRILDFGLAKWNNSTSTVTLQGDVMGTPAYVSPEQAAGIPHDIDARSDTFSLGAILYELIAGQRPFHGDMKLLLHRIRFDDPVSPKAIHDAVPTALSNICMKSLDKAPDDRYQSALEFKQDLDRFLTGEKVDAKPYAPGKHRPSSTSLWVLIATLFCLGLVAVLWWRTMHGESNKQTPSQNVGNVKAEDNKLGNSTPVQNNSSILRGHSATVSHLDFRNDGKQFVSCGHDAQVNLWDWETRSILWTNNDHTDQIWCVDWSPDQNVIATASFDKTVLLLDSATGSVLRRLSGHSDKVCCVLFLQDGRLVSSSLDGTIRFWDVATGKTIKELRHLNGMFVNFTVTPDVKYLWAVGWDGFLTKFDLESNQLVFRNRAHQGSTWDVAYSVEQDLVATCGEDGWIRLWHTETGNKLKERRAAPRHVTCVKFHPRDPNTIMNASHSKTVDAWDGDFNQIVRRFSGHDHWIYEFEFHPDGEHFVSASVDQTIRVWHLNGGEPVENAVVPLKADAAEAGTKS